MAETEQVYDLLGRVTDIVHERAATEFADYDLTWDAAGELTDFDFTSLIGDDGTASYTYDDTSQLTGADYDYQDDESYVYDENGNRTLVDGTTTYTTGDHNRLTSDGTYNYTYDGEGNVLTKTNISTGESVEYTWDHRNRLTKVTYKNSGGTATKIVEYAYDYGQRWVRKTLDTDADGTIESSTVFVHDNEQIVLDFEKTGTGDAGNSDLAHRYLWGANTDDLLADETVDDATEDDVAWALTDHLGSVRDLVVYDPVAQTVSVVKHLVYDAYGNIISDTATGVESLFLYTARPFDPDTELQNNLNRWYDATTGRWLNTDPIGFDAGDVNLYRHVSNSPTCYRDATGTSEEPPQDPFGGMVAPGDLLAKPAKPAIFDPTINNKCRVSTMGGMITVREIPFDPGLGGCYRVHQQYTLFKASEVTRIPLKPGGCEGAEKNQYAYYLNMGVSIDCHASADCDGDGICCPLEKTTFSTRIPFVVPVPWPDPLSIKGSTCLVVLAGEFAYGKTTETGECSHCK